MKILVLEDDLGQQEILKIHGETLGHEVQCVSDLDAFKSVLAESAHPELIIMDNILADGVDAFQEIAWVRDTVGPSVGLVGLTGAESFKNTKERYSDIDQLNHLLVKPLSLDDLESTLFFIGGGEG